MAHAEADDLAAIFFGDNHRRNFAVVFGPLSQCDCDTHPCDNCDICDKQAMERAGGPFQHPVTSRVFRPLCAMTCSARPFSKL